MSGTAKENGQLSAFCDFDIGGLTKREYFAGLAMQGILANSFMAKDGADDGDRLVLNWADCSYNAIGYADALLDALAKETPEATTEEAE